MTVFPTVTGTLLPEIDYKAAIAKYRAGGGGSGDWRGGKGRGWGGGRDYEGEHPLLSFVDWQTECPTFPLTRLAPVKTTACFKFHSL